MHILYFKKLSEAAEKNDVKAFEEIMQDAIRELPRPAFKLLLDELFNLIIEDIKKKTFKILKESIISILMRYHFSINYQNKDGRTLFDYVIPTQNIAAAKILLNVGFDPSRKSKEGTPIETLIKFLFAQGGSMFSFSAKGPLAQIVVLLMNHPKTDLKAIYRNTKSNMAKLAKTFRVEDLEGLSPENARLMGLLKNVILTGHRYDLKGYIDVEGYRCDLEGNNLGIAAKEMIQTYNEFILNPEIRAELNAFLNNLYETKGIDYFDPNRKELNFLLQIQADLSCIGNEMSFKEFQERNQHNQITPVFMCVTVNSFGGHALAYVFTPDYSIRINSGATVNQYETAGIGIRKIDDKKGFLEEIPKILNSLNSPVHDSYLVGDFVARGKLKNIHEIPRPKQTAGNCTWRALLDVVFTLFVMHINQQISKKYDSRSTSLEAATLLGTQLNNLFLRFDKERGLKILKGFEKCLGQENIQIIHQKIERTQLAYLETISWTPSFNGFQTPPKPGLGDRGDQKLGSEQKALLDKDGGKEKSPKFERKGKAEAEILILTEEQLGFIAKEYGRMNDREMLKLVELLNRKDDIRNSAPLFLQFLGCLDGVESILKLDELPIKYSLLFTNGKLIEKYKHLLQKERVKSSAMP